MEGNGDKKNNSLCKEDEFTMEMNIVMKNIYTSCDPDNTNSVQVSKLIDFIKPYLLEDLAALEHLKSALDPEHIDRCVSSEKFYEVMNEWTKRITTATECDDEKFNGTPSRLDVIDDRELPYLQSTPRASFGQKLLNCSGLLNLSNVSSYSSNGLNNTVAADKTVLEEQVKELEHHLQRVQNEKALIKLQLTATEEQNEMLQADLDRVKRRLHSEQQMNEHLQRDKKDTDELKEELNYARKQTEEYQRKLNLAEKDNQYLHNLLKELEQEKANLEQKHEAILKWKEEAKQEIIDLRSALDLKEAHLASFSRINDEMQTKLSQQKEHIEFLENENQLMKVRKEALEKSLREWRSTTEGSRFHDNSPCSNSSDQLGTAPLSAPVTSQPFTFPSAPINANVHLSKSSSSIPLQSRLPRRVSFNTPRFLKQLSNPVTPSLSGSPLYCSSSSLKNSVDSDSPVIQPENSLLKKVLLKNSSTPVESPVVSKTLLDNSLPLEMQNCPVLRPSPQVSNATKSDTAEQDQVSYTDSPPVMYVVNRSEKDKQRNTQPNTETASPQQDYSSEEDLCWKVEEFQSPTCHSPHESLQAEISHVFNENCVTSEDGIEISEQKRESQSGLDKSESQSMSLQNEADKSEILNLELELKAASLEIEKITVSNSALQKDIVLLREQLQEKNEIQLKFEEDNEKLKNTIEKLNTQIDEKNKEIVALEKKIRCESNFKRILEDKLQKEIVDKSLKIVELSSINKELESNPERSKTSDEINNSELHTEKGTKITEICNANEGLEDMQKLQHELNCLRKGNTHIQTDLNEAKTQNVALIETNKELQDNIKYLKKEIESLEKKIRSEYNFKKVLEDNLQKEIYEKSLKIEELMKASKELETNFAACKAENITLTQKSSQLLEINKNIEEIAKKLQSILDDKLYVINQLKDLNSKLEIKISEGEAKLHEKLKEITELRDDIKNELDVKNKLWEQVQTLRDQLEIQQKNNELIAEYNLKLENTNKQQKNEYNNLQQLYNDCKFQLDELNSENVEIKRCVSSLEKSIESKDEIIAKLSKNLEQQSGECSKHIEKYKKLSMDLINNEKRVHSLETSLADVNNKLHEEQKKNVGVDKLKNEIETNKNIFKLLEAEKGLLLSEYKQLKDLTKIQEEGHFKIIYKLKEKLEAMSASMDSNKVFNEVYEKLEKTCLHKIERLSNLTNALIHSKKCDTSEKENSKEEKGSVNDNLKTFIGDALVNELVVQTKTPSDSDVETSSACSCSGSIRGGNDSQTEYKRGSYLKKQAKFERLQIKCDEMEETLKKERSILKEVEMKFDMLQMKYNEMDEQFNKERMKLKDAQMLLTDQQEYHEKRLLEVKTNYAKEQFELENTVRTLTAALVKAEEKNCLLESNFMEKCESASKSDYLLEVKQGELYELKKDTENVNLYLQSKLMDEERKNANLQKKINDMHSKLTEYKDVMENIEKLKGMKGLLETTELELQSIKIKLDMAKVEYSELSEEVLKNNGIISCGTKDLTSIVSKVYKSWKPIFEKEKLRDRKCSKLLKKVENAEAGNKKSTTVINKELDKLRSQIKVVVLMLDILAHRCPKLMETPTSDDSVNSSGISSPESLKPVKRFTLTAPKLLLNCPPSPDTRSVQIEEIINYSPDSLFIENAPLNTLDDSFKTACEGDCFQQVEEIPFQEVFPNLNDPFLEKLGLHENSPLGKLTKDQTEELFTALVIQIALDSNDVKTRQEKQKNRCMQEQDKFIKMIRSVTSVLREHKCIGAPDSVTPVFVLLEEMKFLLRDLITSVEQYGALNYEARMMKCWNLVTNYTALLRQDTQSGLSPSIKVDSPTQTVNRSLLKARRRSGLNSSQSEPNPLQLRAPHILKRNRFYCINYTIIGMFFSLIVFALGFILVQWQCQMATNENQLCPLDLIIKKTITGVPPH